MNDAQPTETPVILSGRVVIARQVLPLCGDAEAADEQGELGPVEDNEPQPGDLKLSSSLDAHGRLAFQDGRHRCFFSGVLTASVYDGAAWRRFDLRSITPHVSYPNPALLRDVIARVRSAAAIAAGQLCLPGTGGSGDAPTRERPVAAGGRAQEA